MSHHGLNGLNVGFIPARRCIYAAGITHLLLCWLLVQSTKLFVFDLDQKWSFLADFDFTSRIPRQQIPLLPNEMSMDTSEDSSSVPRYPADTYMQKHSFVRYGMVNSNILGGHCPYGPRQPFSFGDHA